MTRKPGTARAHASGRRCLPLAVSALGIALAVGCNTRSEGGSSGEQYPDSDILVARSADGGLTWTAPAALNVDAVTDFGADEIPQLTTDAGGVWLAVWQSTSFDPQVRDDFDLMISHSGNLGTTWLGQAELNSEADTDAPTEGDLAPQLTTDRDGNWVAVWDSTAGYNRPPQPDGSVPPDSDILTARSADDGATWSAQVALNTNAASDDGEDAYPQLTTDGSGNWIAVWHSTDWLGDTIKTDFDILFARSTDVGASWSAPLPLNSEAAIDSPNLLKPADDDKYPQVTSDGAGNWVAVWNSDRGYNEDCPTGKICTDQDILMSRSTDLGVTWSAQVALNSNAVDDLDGENDIRPQLTTDGNGLWIAVWESNATLGDTIGSDEDILFARSTDDGASWSPVAPLNTNAATDTGDDTVPQLTTDAQGLWIATWASTDSLGGTIGTDADILIARSTDGGGSWSAPAALNTDAVGDAENDQSPQLTTDADGAWVAVWQSMESL